MSYDGDGTPSALREHNKRRVLEVLLGRLDDGATQAEIMAATSLSRASVTNLLQTLRPVLTNTAAGAARAPARAGGRATGGRPAAVIAIDPRATAAAAVDIGRSHVLVAVCDLTGGGGELAYREDSALRFDISTAAHRTLDRAAGLLNDVIEQQGLSPRDLAGIAVGLPGPVGDGRPRGRVMPDWEDLDVADAAREALRRSAREWGRLGRQLPVLVDNDANASSVGECLWGVGRGRDNVLYVKWATGVGAGLVLDGQVRRGAGGVAGEFAHTPLHGPDARGVPTCPGCSQRCLEAAIGFRTLLPNMNWRAIQEAAADQSHPGHAGVAEFVTRGAQRLGRALVPLVNVLNPELIIVDGILDERAEPLFAPPILRELDRGVLASARRDLKVRGGRFTVTAAARGGLARVLNELALEFLLERAGTTSVKT